MKPSYRTQSADTNSVGRTLRSSVDRREPDGRGLHYSLAQRYLVYSREVTREAAHAADLASAKTASSSRRMASRLVSTLLMLTF